MGRSSGNIAVADDDDVAEFVGNVVVTPPTPPPPTLALEGGTGLLNCKDDDGDAEDGDKGDALSADEEDDGVG